MVSFRAVLVCLAVVFLLSSCSIQAVSLDENFKPVFLPSPAVTYTAPVFVRLSCENFCATNTSDVLIYRNDDPHGTLYTGPFWIDQTTRLTAVRRFNSEGKSGAYTSSSPVGTILSRVSYRIESLSTPTLQVFPPGGTFINEVKVLIHPSNSRSDLFYSVDGDEPTEISSDFLIPLRLSHFISSSSGDSTHAQEAINGGRVVNLTVWQFDTVGGKRASISHQYHLLPADLPRIFAVATTIPRNTFSTPPLLEEYSANVFDHEVEVFCLDPLNHTLPVQLLNSRGEAGSAPPSIQIFAKEGVNVSLNRIGTYRVGCEYTLTDADHPVSYFTSRTVALEPVPIAAPRFLSPSCGARVLHTALFLQVEVPRGSQLEVTPLASGGGGRLTFMMEDAAAGNTSTAVMVAGFLPGTDGAAIGEPVTLSATAESTTHMKNEAAARGRFLAAQSQSSTCALTFVELGNVTSEPVFARAVCDDESDADHVHRTSPTLNDQDDVVSGSTLSRSCFTRIQEGIARCLHFYTSDLVEMNTSGPYIAVSVKGLPNDYAIQKQYHDRLVRCVESGVVPQVVSAGDHPSVAFSWKLRYGSSADPNTLSVTAGTTFMLEVVGVNARNGIYKLVYADLDGCHHLGTAPLFGPQESQSIATIQNTDSHGSMNDTTKSNSEESWFPLWFNIPLPGKYKLCVLFQSQLTDNVEEDSSIAFDNMFTSKDFYEVPSARSITTPLRVTGRQFPLFKTTNSGGCGGPLLPSKRNVNVSFDVVGRSQANTSLQHTMYLYSTNTGPWEAQVLGEPITTSVSGANPFALVSASLGEHSAVSSTCIYYYHYAADQSSVNQRAANFTYSFYQLQRSISVTLPGAGASALDGVRNNEEHQNDTGSVDEVVIALHGEFRPDERIIIEVYQDHFISPEDERQNSTTATMKGDPDTAMTNNASRMDGPIFQTTASASSAWQYRWALPQTTMSLSRRQEASMEQPASRGMSTPTSTAAAVTTAHVFAILDGEKVEIRPSSVTLSSLALRMQPSNICQSGFRFGDECVCFGEVNHTAYLCGSILDGGETQGPANGNNGEVSTSTSAPSKVDPNIMVPSTAERLVPLLVYFVLLGALAGYMLYSMQRGDENAVVEGIQNGVDVDDEEEDEGAGSV